MDYEVTFDAEEYYWKIFNEINDLINSLNKKQKEELEDFLGNMEESTPYVGRTLKEYEKYIKKFKRKNKILFIAFKTKNISKLAHICKYILDLEWNNEWAIAVAGQHTPTIFGWFD